ncbi:hypothetical protein KUCAC02_033598, partial [Chaenocephalus aceratus]
LRPSLGKKGALNASLYALTNSPAPRDSATRYRPGTDRVQTRYRPGTDQVQTGYRPGTDRVQTGYRPGTDQVQTGYRPGTDRVQTGYRPGTDRVRTGVPRGWKTGRYWESCWDLKGLRRSNGGEGRAYIDHGKRKG